ncbi:hypothetical protein FJT64_020239 [Amphibalanus amphitrite]|uniref:Protection of telomeres protein 1 n=1 Tax=Amphibalanus amphitrite TaxID=1232801 RepID=A0A6A4WR94_AMPAM|nr:hypothetical protein FJT64_020239 [Amphibalanus amphitrite]
MELWADSAQSQTAHFLRDIPASDPDNVYTLLRDVGLDDPPLQLRPSLMGVITNVPQPPRHTQRSYMFMVVLKDPSCWDDASPRKDFVVFGFVPSPADLPAAGDDHGLRPGNVLRLRSVKVERRAGKLDGRVFRGSQLDVFSGAEDGPPVPLGAAGRPVTEAERRRLQWLRRWWLVERPHQERIAAATDARLSDVSGPGLCHLKVRLLALDESDGRLIARVTDGTRCPLPVGGPADPTPPGSSEPTDPAAGYSRVPVYVADRSCAEALRRGPADAVRFLYLVRVRVDCSPPTEDTAAPAATFAMERADDPLVLPLDVSSDDVMDIRLRMEPATAGPGRGRAGTGPGWNGTTPGAAPAPTSMVSAAAQTDMSFGEVSQQSRLCRIQTGLQSVFIQ